MHRTMNDKQLKVGTMCLVKKIFYHFVLVELNIVNPIVIWILVYYFAAWNVVSCKEQKGWIYSSITKQTTYEQKQCAAVRMNFELIMVPPHQCPPFLVMLTSQGNSRGMASWPPTTRAERIPAAPWPQGTSATVINCEFWRYSCVIYIYNIINYKTDLVYNLNDHVISER